MLYWPGLAVLRIAQHGARILRVHDVAETHDALAIWQALEGSEQAAPNPAQTGQKT